MKLCHVTALRKRIVRSVLTAAAVIAAGLGASTAQALDIPLTNAGFEAADLFPAANRVQGWTTTLFTSSGSVAPGIYVAPIEGVQATQFHHPGQLVQGSGHAILANTAYTASVLVKRHPNATPSNGTIELWAGNPSVGTLLASETMLTADYSSAVWTLLSVTANIGPSGAVIGENLHVLLKTAILPTVTTFNYFDDVQLSSEVIPEPASLALLGLGALMLVRRRRA